MPGCEREAEEKRTRRRARGRRVLARLTALRRVLR